MGNNPEPIRSHEHSWPVGNQPKMGSAEWCRGTELNCRHQPFQGCALPTELPRHGSGQEERGTVTGSSEKNQAAWSVTFREPPKQIVAEREGFEPSVEVLPLRRFSKPLPSATRPPLHWSQLYAASGTVMQTGQNVDGLHLWHNIAAILSQDAQKGRSARSQRVKRRRVRFGTLSLFAMRERCWQPFSASCYAGFPMICDRSR